MMIKKKQKQNIISYIVILVSVAILKFCGLTENNFKDASIRMKKLNIAINENTKSDKWMEQKIGYNNSKDSTKTWLHCWRIEKNEKAQPTANNGEQYHCDSSLPHCVPPPLRVYEEGVGTAVDKIQYTKIQNICMAAPN